MDVNGSTAPKNINTTVNVSASRIKSKDIAPKTANTNNSNEVNIKRLNNIINENRGDEIYLSVSDKAIAAAIEHINKVVEGSNIGLEYVVHKATNSIVIRMRDKETNEIIKEIPPEKVLDVFAQRMKILGLYVDDRG